MDDELSKAKSEEEKQNILKKYNDKISTATGGKVTVPTNPTKPSGNTDKGSSGGQKPSTDNTDSENKPSGGGDKGDSSSSGSSGGKEPDKPSHTHIAAGNAGKWFSSHDEAEAYYMG